MTPLRERYGTRVRDQAGVRGTVTRFDEPVRYEYEREMVFVRVDRDVAGQDLYWYDEHQLTIIPNQRRQTRETGTGATAK